MVSPSENSAADWTSFGLAEDCAIGRIEIQLHAQVAIGNCVVINDGCRLLTGTHDIHSPRWELIAKPICYRGLCVDRHGGNSHARSHHRQGRGRRGRRRRHKIDPTVRCCCRESGSVDRAEAVSRFTVSSKRINCVVRGVAWAASRWSN